MCALWGAANLLVTDSAMTPTSLIIVTDRGSLKAYRVDETPTRGPSLHLVQAFDLTDAHGKLIDKVTDLAGRFPERWRRGEARELDCRANPAGNRDSSPDSEAISRSNHKNCLAQREGRMVIRRASGNSRRDYRSFTRASARPDRRTCEIRSRQNRAIEIARSFSFTPIDLKMLDFWIRNPEHSIRIVIEHLVSSIQHQLAYIFHLP